MAIPAILQFFSREIFPLEVIIGFNKNEYIQSIVVRKLWKLPVPPSDCLYFRKQEIIQPKAYIKNHYFPENARK